MTLEFPSDSSFLDLLSIEAEVRNWLITEWVDVSAPAGLVCLSSELELRAAQKLQTQRFIQTSRNLGAQ